MASSPLPAKKGNGMVPWAILDTSHLQATFCPHCGSLLDLPRPGQTIVNCVACTACCPSDLFARREIVTRFKPTRTRREQQQRDEESGKATAKKESGGQEELATIAHECPNCGAARMYYYTRQLRSADEGQTVFYECPDCDYKFNENS